MAGGRAGTAVTALLESCRYAEIAYDKSDRHAICPSVAGISSECLKLSCSTIECIMMLQCNI